MYQRSHYYQGRRHTGAMNYVMPFLIIICVGIIGILLFNLWQAFFPPDKVKAAYLHVLNGSAQMKAWGTDSFFNLSTDAVIMQGDQVRSSADGRFIVEFFDGSLMRMDGNTDVSFDAVDDDDTPKIELRLYDGNIWFNLSDKNSGDTDVNVTLDNIVADSNLASIFELENNDSQAVPTGRQAVRVFSVFENEGLNVDVLAEDGNKVVESEKIGVGQQIIFTDEVLKRYFAYQSPTVLAAIDDEFKLADWYLWNLKEDDQPTRFEKIIGPAGTTFVKVEPQVVDEKENVDNVEPEKAPAEAVEASAKSDVVAETKSTSNADSTVGTSVAGKPIITSVAGGAKIDSQGKYQVTSRVTTLMGTIFGVDKVVVNGYTLQKFKPGDTTWTYFANADFDLMKAGDNTYEIYGLDSKGNKTESLVIKVFYTPQALPGETVPDVTSVVSVDADSTGTTETSETDTVSGLSDEETSSSTVED